MPVTAPTFGAPAKPAAPKPGFIFGAPAPKSPLGGITSIAGGQGPGSVYGPPPVRPWVPGAQGPSPAPLQALATAARGGVGSGGSGGGGAPIGSPERDSAGMGSVARGYQMQDQAALRRTQLEDETRLRAQAAADRQAAINQRDNDRRNDEVLRGNAEARENGQARLQRQRQADAAAVTRRQQLEDETRAQSSPLAQENLRGARLQNDATSADSEARRLRTGEYSDTAVAGGRGGGGGGGGGNSGGGGLSAEEERRRYDEASALERQRYDAGQRRDAEVRSTEQARYDADQRRKDDKSAYDRQPIDLAKLGALRNTLIPPDAGDQLMGGPGANGGLDSGDAVADQAFGRAKDTAGLLALRRMSDVRSQLGGSSVGTQARATDAVLGDASSGLQDFALGQAETQAKRGYDVADRNYAGKLTRRGQDSNTMNNILSTLGQRSRLY